MELGDQPLAPLAPLSNAYPAVPGTTSSHASSESNVFGDFVSRLSSHEEMGGVLPAFLRNSAIWADVFLIAVLLLASTMSASSIASSGFFLIGGSLAASLVAVLHILAWPLIPLAIAGLVAKLWMRDQRAHETIHVLCGIETAAAVVVSIPPALFLIIVLLEAALWVIIIAAIFCIGIAILVGVLRALFRA